ncbi:unnamed protein product, partial [Protopolystoma xenopodis]
MSMDASGKVVCARHAELVQANLRSLSSGDAISGGQDITVGNITDEIKDGERLIVTFKQMGTCELYPQTISHNANGSFVVVCGDGEYIVYTAVALRNKTFGQAQEFVWSSTDASVYAIRESNTIIRVRGKDPCWFMPIVFKAFKKVRTFKLDFGAEQIFGGHLLGVRSSGGLALHDWESGNLIRRIEASPNAIYWNEGGRLLAICTKEVFYILRYNADIVAEAEADGSLFKNPEGLETAFEVTKNGEVAESVITGCWYGDVFIFTSQANRLRYYVGGELVTIAHLDRPMYLLGYLARANRAYLADRELNLISYGLQSTVLEYETAVMRGDFVCADNLLPNIP